MPRNTRRQSREAAVQALYAMNFTNLDRHETTARLGMLEGADIRPQDGFSARLLELVEQHVDTIDACLARSLKGWTPERLEPAMRSLLRLGLAEILYCTDIPARAAINEYIELSRAFGDDDAPGLVNAVLDRARREHEAAPAQPPVT